MEEKLKQIQASMANIDDAKKSMFFVFIRLIFVHAKYMNLNEI